LAVAAPTAAFLLSLHPQGEKKHAVNVAVNGVVGGAVRDAISGAVAVAVRVAVDDAVDVAVRVAVDDAVDGAVRDAVNGARSARGPRATKEIRDALLDTIRRGWAYYLGGRWWGGGWYYWGMAYVAFFRDVVGLKLPGDTWDRSHAYADMMSAGWLWPHKDFVMVCEPPVTLHLEDRLMPGQRWRRLHNEHGPAIAWRDGTALWYLRGMSVPQQLVESPETITAEQIATERNAEVRRVMLDRFTAARFVREIGATIVDAHELHGKLYRYDQRDDEAVCVLEVVNASPEPIGYEAGPNDVVRDGRVWKTYFLRVPPTCSTALEARAWTFDIAPKDFSPLVES
jgi:hypothetical protein